MGLLLGLLRRRKVGGVVFYMITRSKDGKKKSGHWFLDTDQPEKRIYLSCPFCRTFYDITSYEVNREGMVNPCITCRKTMGGCGRHFHVILRDWDLGFHKETGYWGW